MKRLGQLQKSALETHTHLLPRVDSFHVVCVNIDIGDKLVEDAPCGIHDPVGHLRRHAHGVPVVHS